MFNPVLLYLLRTSRKPRPRGIDADLAAIPTAAPSTDAIFLVLRRMRGPLILLVGVFAISVFGLALTPGVNPDGTPTHMSVFDAFYVMSYTATTIGFGELPQPFSYQQRMWVTLSIYLTVIGWAYAIGTLFALLQDHSFRTAVKIQRFARKVRLLREPFFIIAGYGQAGRAVAHDLDEHGHRFVVVEHHAEKIDLLDGDQLSVDVPCLVGDASRPDILGLAGLNSRYCEGILALTSDSINLGMVMMADLLRPGLPVIARCSDRVMAERMDQFTPSTVINPYDRYGAYLVLAVQRPTTYQLVDWLLSPAGTPLGPRPDQLTTGHWVVCADGQFQQEVVRDLESAGLDVRLIEHGDGDPDLAGAAGFVAGTSDDPNNLALLDHAQRTRPEAFTVLRQDRITQMPLVTALHPDSLFVPTALVANETLARIVTPVFWTFVEHALAADETWSTPLLARIRERCGDLAPERELVTIDRADAPAVVHLLESGRTITFGDLLRVSNDRETPLATVPLLVKRGDQLTFIPDDDFALALNDQVLLAGRVRALSDLRGPLTYPTTLEYVLSGREVPSTWLWRVLTRQG